MLLVLAYYLVPKRALPVNALGIAVALFCGWMLWNAVLVSPNYSADGLYRPCILFGGFAVGAALGRASLVQLFRAGATLLALLVLVGLLQFFFGFWHLAQNPQRAAAIFITPNTFATAINLFLLPLVALTFVRGSSRWAYVLALWMFAGLLATESRGGWLAGLAGLAFIAWYLGIPRTRKEWEPWLRLIAGLLSVFIAFRAMMWVAPLIGTASPTGLASTFGDTVVSRGTSLRTDIYAVTLGLIEDRPVAGYGADMFRTLFEMHKPASMDTGHTFLFVHNDYLQVWLEYGLVGIALMGAVIAAALALLLRSRRANGDIRLPLAGGAAIAGVLTHATVDFPLYIPFVLLLLGLWLGALAAAGGEDAQQRRLIPRFAGRLGLLRSMPVAGALSIAALAWLAQPVLAEAAGRKAVSELLSGRADDALYWQSVARRLEPRKGAHYWAEGVIWRDQAVAGRDKALAARADSLFAKGMLADPHQIANFLDRARLRRSHADLFDGRSENEILEWTGEALRLQPYSMLAQAERARALDHAGRTDEAKRIAQAMLERHPGAEMAKGLAKEFHLPAAAGKTP